MLSAEWSAPMTRGGLTCLPLLENENVDPPSIAPYKKLYFQQYGGGPGIIRSRDRPIT